MLSHFGALTTFALLVSVVFAIITKSEPREQIRYGIFVFFSFLAAAILVGWIMFPLPI
jgi:heme A synthase